MRLRLKRHHLRVIFIAFVATLLVGGLGIARFGERPLESFFVACRKILFLTGGNLSLKTVIGFTIIALLLLGLASAIIGFIRDTVSLRALEKRAMRSATVLSESPKVFLTKNVSHQAWTSGFFRSRVYLSSESYSRLSERERKALLAHELAHVRNHDVVKRALVDVLRRLFWFVPTVGELARIIRFDQEVRADHVAMAVAGKRALCGLYLSMHDEKVPSYVSGFSFISPRLREVLDGKPVKAELSISRLVMSLSMLAVVFFIGWGMSTKPALAETSSDCTRLEMTAPHSIVHPFTPVVRPLEFHAPIPESTCSGSISC